ncbi:diguanylate cyclase [Paenibacillus chartarius]|uniref:Diguanylate cyclase n=1 Tax=Paenibacillus chartarius TaxID=747481 RepID=A0ABV6DMM5_9BACL
MLIGFVLGAAMSTFVWMLLIRYKNNKDTGKEYLRGFMELAEGTKDRLYYFETKPKWRYRYFYPPLKDPELDRMVYDNPEILLSRVHPDDYELLIRKINGEVDFSQPILYRMVNYESENKEYVWYEEFTTPIYKNGELVAIQGILRNVDEKLKLQEELEYRIEHDTLTGVYNRSFFETIVEKYNSKMDVPIAIIIGDLDKLKQLNDTLGHKLGDKYIMEAASLLKQFARENVLISRIGGDEYCIIVVEADEDHVSRLKESILQAISLYNASSPDLQIEMSIGYAFAESSLGNMDQLFIEADRNMYQEKYLKKMGREVSK